MPPLDVPTQFALQKYQPATTQQHSISDTQQQCSGEVVNKSLSLSTFAHILSTDSRDAILKTFPLRHDVIPPEFWKVLPTLEEPQEVVEGKIQAAQQITHRKNIRKAQIGRRTSKPNKALQKSKVLAAMQRDIKDGNTHHRQRKTEKRFRKNDEMSPGSDECAEDANDTWNDISDDESRRRRRRRLMMTGGKVFGKLHGPIAPSLVEDLENDIEECETQISDWGGAAGLDDGRPVLRRMNAGSLLDVDVNCDVNSDVDCDVDCDVNCDVSCDVDCDVDCDVNGDGWVLPQSGMEGVATWAEGLP